jgi:hypothetical protein
MIKKLISMLMAVVVAFSITGCAVKKPTKVEAPQVTFSRSLLAAADAVDLVASGIVAADECRKNLKITGQIDANGNAEFLEYLQKLAKANEDARRAIEIAAAGDVNVDWKGALLQITHQVVFVDPATFGIKNQDAQLAFKISMATLDSSLQIITASFGGK